MSAPPPDLPQQGRWRLIDRVLQADDERVIAERDFTSEDCQGHLPGDPIVPGVLLVEGLAQAMLVLHRRLDEGTPLLAGVDRVRFKAPVRPPATVRFEVARKAHHGGSLRTQGSAFLGEQLVCTAVLTGTLAGPQ